MTTKVAVSVDPANAEQLRAWDGDEGSYWAAHADEFDRSIADYDEAFLGGAAIVDGEQVLDIGCGTGHTTIEAARRTASGSALGVDLSSSMLAVARRRAVDRSVPNVGFEQADAQVHPFEPAFFDVAIARTSAMFFGDQVAGLANVGRALRSGGRLVLLTWQPVTENEWFRELSGALAAGRDLPMPPPDRGPFSLADPARVHEVLGAAGYVDIELSGHESGMWFGHDGEAAHAFVLGLLGWMLEGLDDVERTHAVEALRATTSAHDAGDGVVYDSAVWITRAVRP